MDQLGSYDAKIRRLLIAVRQALLIMIGGIEDYLGLERSVVPKRKK
jgi:hypothetical protein